ncbi:MAG: RNA polymerase subunit sigma [Bordetella sp. SCN 67-23]|nr:sigma-70 family RNA polymerase sigma factor [Burkholderiales bacterium]ODS71652.1 MAG: RNA polymerase subunit sigma [Bordetella sp. SCN 67-23]OJW87364.1 MAG: RNA polymerase subunit sigma [Burkholderiales bacterium 67-32]
MTAVKAPVQHTVETLYCDHHAWLREWLRKRLGHAGDAADLAQDTFVRLLRTCRLPERRDPRDFLVHVAKGLVVDLFRRRSIERLYLEALASRPADAAPSAEQQALWIEALVRVDAMLDGLGPKVKQVFILSQVDGLPYAEIARQQGISLRSVNNYMARAVEHCVLLRMRQHDG